MKKYRGIFVASNSPHLFRLMLRFFYLYRVRSESFGGINDHGEAQ